MEFAAELQASLQEFTAFGIVELRENGGCVAPFSGMSWEVRGDGEKPLLHLWSEQLNLTRRVLAITDHSEQRLALAVERFGRAARLSGGARAALPSDNRPSLEFSLAGT